MTSKRQDESASKLTDGVAHAAVTRLPSTYVTSISSRTAAAATTRQLIDVIVQRRWSVRDLTAGNCGKWLIRQPLRTDAVAGHPNGCRPRVSWPGRSAESIAGRPSCMPCFCMHRINADPATFSH